MGLPVHLSPLTSPAHLVSALGRLLLHRHPLTLWWAEFPAGYWVGFPAIAILSFSLCPIKGIEILYGNPNSPWFSAVSENGIENWEATFFVLRHLVVPRIKTLVICLWVKVPSHEHLSGIFLPILVFFCANIGSKKCAKCRTITGVFLPVLAFPQLLLLLFIGSGCFVSHRNLWLRYNWHKVNKASLDHIFSPICVHWLSKLPSFIRSVSDQNKDCKQRCQYWWQRWRSLAFQVLLPTLAEKRHYWRKKTPVLAENARNVLVWRRL